MDGIESNIAFRSKVRKARYSIMLNNCLNISKRDMVTIQVKDYTIAACWNSRLISFGTNGYRIGFRDFNFVRNSTLCPSKLVVMKSFQQAGSIFV